MRLCLMTSNQDSIGISPLTAEQLFASVDSTRHQRNKESRRGGSAALSSARDNMGGDDGEGSSVAEDLAQIQATVRQPGGAEELEDDTKLLTWSCFSQYSIDPRSRRRIAWSVFIAALDLVTFVLTPVALIWEDDGDDTTNTALSFFFTLLPSLRSSASTQGAVDYFGLFLDATFLVDIIVNLMTRSLDVTVSLRRHRILYSRFWLWIHLLSCIPSLLFPAFRLLRVFDIFRLWQYCRYYLKSSGNLFLYYFLRVISAFCLLACSVHIFGCFWMVLGLNDRGSWIDAYDTQLRIASIETQLSYSYHFVAMLFTTVGHTEIYPRSVSEFWFAIFTSFCGLMMLAYLVAVGFSILMAAAEESNESPPPFKIKQELIAWLGRFGGDITADEAEETLCYFRSSDGSYEPPMTLGGGYPSSGGGGPHGGGGVTSCRWFPLYHPFIHHVPPPLRLRLAIAAQNAFIDGFHDFLQSIDATDLFVEDFLFLIRRRMYFVTGENPASVLIPLGEQVREVLFLTEGCAVLTGENAEETQKGLRVQKGFWWGGHQCMEHQHFSPIHAHWRDPHQPAEVYFVNIWDWRSLIRRHPIIGRNIIDLSKKQTLAILSSLRVPDAQRYTTGEIWSGGEDKVLDSAGGMHPHQPQVRHQQHHQQHQETEIVWQHRNSPGGSSRGDKRDTGAIRILAEELVDGGTLPDSRNIDHPDIEKMKIEDSNEWDASSDVIDLNGDVAKERNRFMVGEADIPHRHPREDLFRAARETQTRNNKSIRSIISSESSAPSPTSPILPSLKVSQIIPSPAREERMGDISNTHLSRIPKDTVYQKSEIALHHTPVVQAELVPGMEIIDISGGGPGADGTKVGQGDFVTQLRRIGTSRLRTQHQDFQHSPHSSPKAGEGGGSGRAHLLTPPSSSLPVQRSWEAAQSAQKRNRTLLRAAHRGLGHSKSHLDLQAIMDDEQQQHNQFGRKKTFLPTLPE